MEINMVSSAIFIAGDENIYFPALVAIESIRAHNRGVFDYFICFDREKLTPYMEMVLNSKSINFINTKDLDSEFNISKRFKEMSEGHWPVDVFYNYVIPICLGNMGYSYSYKVDYDVLCTGKYDLNEIEPKDVVISGWSNKLNLASPGVPQSVIDDFVKDGTIRNQNVDYMNVGFIGFNNKKYIELDMYSVFAEAYEKLFRLCPKAKLLEQIAFSLLIESTGGDFLNFSEAYNHRVLAIRKSDNNFLFDTKNIHFIT